jgi:hypothetical protein
VPIRIGNANAPRSPAAAAASERANPESTDASTSQMARPVSRALPGKAAPARHVILRVAARKFANS